MSPSVGQTELEFPSLQADRPWRPPDDFPVRLRRSKRSRHLRLEIAPDAVNVVAPTRASVREIEALIQEKQAWIEAGVAEMRAVLRKRIFPRRYVTGSRIPCGERTLRLEIVRAQTPRTADRIRRSGGRLIARVHPDAFGLDREAEARTLVRRWYCEEVVACAHRIVAGHCDGLRLYPAGIRGKWMASRWGSCGPTGWLNLNGRLLGAPEHVLEYVVVHELCHLRHMHHRPSFWALVGSALPDYGRSVDWLAQNGARLLVD